MTRATILGAIPAFAAGFGGYFVIRAIRSDRRRRTLERWARLLLGIGFLVAVPWFTRTGLADMLLLELPDASRAVSAGVLVVLGVLGAIAADWLQLRVITGLGGYLASRQMQPASQSPRTDPISAVLTLTTGLAVLVALMLGVDYVDLPGAAELEFVEGPTEVVLTSVPFSVSIVDPAPPLQAHVKAVGDLDGDGFPDIAVGGGREGYGLFWYRYPDWSKHEIAPPGIGFTTDMIVDDVDSDGDNDILVPQGFHRGESVWWYENPSEDGDPSELPWMEHFIGDAPAHDMEAADFNGDGLLDVVVRDTDLTLFLQDPVDAWRRVDLGAHPVEGTTVGDIDSDGDPDIVVGPSWLENPGPVAEEGAPWAEYTIAEVWPEEAAASLGDVNGDAIPDVVLAPAEVGAGKLSWFEGSEDPRQSPWREHVIAPDVEFLHQFVLADYDLDGDIDLAAAEMHQAEPPQNVSLYLNQSGGEFWDEQVLSTTGSHNLQGGDVDSDGDIDLVGVNWDGESPLWLWRNQIKASNDSLNAWYRHIIDEALPTRAIFVAMPDVDGDGLVDIVAGGWWWKNPGFVAGSWTRFEIGEPLRQMATVHDFDGDGDVDVLGTRGVGNEPNSQFAWAENDGSGAFEIHTNIPSGEGAFLQGVTVADFSGITQVALSWQQGVGGIQLLTVPEDPAGEQWQWERLSSTSLGEGLDSGDIDGDGDLDLSLGLTWFRNDGGSWSEFSVHTPAEGQTDRVHLVDVDSDGDLDTLIGYGHDPEGKLAWYENTGELEREWPEHLIDNVVNPQSVDFRDLDGDGDIDVVAGEHRLESDSYENAALFAYENLDAAAGLWRRYPIYIGDEHHDGAQLADFDEDGDLDVVSIGWFHSRLHIYEALSSTDRWDRIEIEGHRGGQSVFVRPADLDADGLTDVVVGDSWYRNPGDPMVPWSRMAFGGPLNDAATVFDFDGDGDLDVLGSQGMGQDDNPELAWARNDGGGQFVVLTNIDAAEGNFLQGVAVTAENDVIEVAVSWQDRNGGIQLYSIPDDPSGNTWTFASVADVGEGEDVDFGDIDADGDNDLLLGPRWLERVSGSEWVSHDLAPEPLVGGPDRVSLVDVDGDGRLDAVVGASREGRRGSLVWYRQPEQATDRWQEHIIRDDLIGGGMSLDTLDMDGDGDIDVVVGEHDLDEPAHAYLRTMWLENVDGTGTLWEARMIYRGDEHHDGTQVFDADNDGDLDVASLGWSNDHVVLYVNESE